MQSINPLTAIRSLKGAPLSCLVALMFSGQPVGKDWLSRVTGYSDKPVSAALSYLLEMGFVITAGRYESWSINSQAIQLSEASQFTLPDSSRNNSDSLPTTTALINKELKEREVVVDKPRSRNFSESHKLLQFARVGEPMATILADMDHVTPYYVAAHYIKAKAEKTRTALFIHRMKSNDLAPELNQKYHLFGCTCMNCHFLVFTEDRGLLSVDEFDPLEFLESLTDQTQGF
ncbi:MAG: hypothetical protein ACYDH1_01485 [Anaerolineaceae bacterium]